MAWLGQALVDGGDQIAPRLRRLQSLAWSFAAFMEQSFGLEGRPTAELYLLAKSRTGR